MLDDDNADELDDDDDDDDGSDIGGSVRIPSAFSGLCSLGAFLIYICLVVGLEYYGVL